jgi:hypothetical protein
MQYGGVTVAMIPFRALPVALTILIGAAMFVPPLEAGPATAEDSRYKELVAKASNGDLSIDFRALRLACLKTSGCDPTGDTKDMIAMRRAMQSKEYNTAAKLAETLTDHGFVNIEAHADASQAYEAMNKPDKAKFHHDVTTSLLRSILSSGDGKTKETAFEVIGTFEEYIVMSVLGLPALGSQSLMPGKPNSYDVLERTNPKTGQSISVYFKIDAFYPPKGL